jgi:hypothetical protein
MLVLKNFQTDVLSDWLTEFRLRCGFIDKKCNHAE